MNQSVGIDAFKRLKKKLILNLETKFCCINSLAMCCAMDQFIHCGNYNDSIHSIIRQFILGYLWVHTVMKLMFNHLCWWLKVLGWSSSRRWSGLRAHQWNKLRMKDAGGSSSFSSGLLCLCDRLFTAAMFGNSIQSRTKEIKLFNICLERNCWFWSNKINEFWIRTNIILPLFWNPIF